MKNSSCEVLTHHYPTISEFDDLRSTCISNCVFNSFLSHSAITMNIIAIHAIRKTSSLPKSLKTLLLSLAVSDVGVGLLVQPFYISLLLNWAQHKDPRCISYAAFDIIIGLFSLASFLGVVAISVDRFLAVHLHLRYQELVTHKRVVAVVISIWLLSAFYAMMALWAPPNIRSLFVFIVGFVCLPLTAVVYIRIYLVARRHKNQIQALQAQQVTQAGEMENFARLIKYAGGMFYVFLVFLACFLPSTICLAVMGISGSNIAMKKFLYFSLTIVFLNSSLNPVIYCWKMRQIRHAFMDVLRNMQSRIAS